MAAHLDPRVEQDEAESGATVSKTYFQKPFLDLLAEVFRESHAEKIDRNVRAEVNLLFPIDHQREGPTGTVSQEPRLQYRLRSMKVTSQEAVAVLKQGRD